VIDLVAVIVCPCCAFRVNRMIWARLTAEITKKRAVNITAGSLNIKYSYPIWIVSTNQIRQEIQNI
jgi:hypothetical protein